MRRTLALLACIALGGCANESSVSSRTTAGFVPVVRAAAMPAPSAWSVFPITGVYATNGGIATDGGAIWLTGREALVKMSVKGAYQTYSLDDFDPTSLLMSSGGRIYTASCCTLSGDYAILSVTTSGIVRSYVPKSKDGINDGVAEDHSGNFWFSEYAHVGKMSPAGAITEYPLNLPDGLAFNTVAGITLGGDGRVWFPVNNNNTSPYDGYLAAVDTSNGSVTMYPTPCFDPEPVIGAADGNLYAACRTVNSTKVDILRMTTSGATKIINDPYGVTFGGNVFAAVATGVYFVTFTGGTHPNSLGFLNTSTEKITLAVPPSAVGGLSAVTPSAEGRLWALSEDEHALQYREP